jgi:hypothetical protein
MYSPEIHAAILDAYKSLDNYERVLADTMDKFEIPDECKVALDPADSKEAVLAKLRNVPIGMRGAVWLSGAVVRGKVPDLCFPLMNYVVEAVKELRHLQEGKTFVHLQGYKPTDGVMHPKYLHNFVGDKPKFALSNGARLPFYAKGTNMVEMTLVFDADGSISLGGMAFRWSNFMTLDEAVRLADDLGIECSATWKTLFVNRALLSTEEVIQMLKVYASLSQRHRLVGNDACKASLEMRRDKLAAVGVVVRDDDMSVTVAGADAVTLESYEQLNGFVNARLCDMATLCSDPATLKLIGNAVGINGGTYFGPMNGEIVDPMAPDYARVGNNARVMSAGILLRMLRGEAPLVQAMDFCHKYGIRVFELAVHGGKGSLGAFADEGWGVAACSARMSPLAFLVRGGKCYSAFGNGVNAVLDAKRGVAAAQAFIGLDGCALETKEELRAAAAACFAKALDIIEP